MQKQLTIQTQSELKTAAFTGHRKLQTDFSETKLYEETEKLVKQGVTTFYNGMAMGFDLCAAETVLALKKTYPDIKLVACIPVYNQEKNYSETDKKRYVEILKNADEKITLAEHYFKGCMQLRDRYMADRADALVCYCKKQTGGTAYTVKYFTKKYPFKPVLFI